MRFFFVTILFILINISGLFSQEDEFKCSTPEMNRLARALNPDYPKAQELFLQSIEYYKNHKPKTEEVLIIPVVFHVVHEGGIENISKEQIEDAIRCMNNDFRKMSQDTGMIIPEFKQIAADCKIEFRLAKIDPNGNCTEGITRTYSELTNQADESVKDVVPAWPRSMYLNIWVVKSIGSGAAGYSYYPSSVDGSWGETHDGIVVLHSYVGSIGTSIPSHSRTLTHEAGHYLGLPHTWGNSNDPGLQDNCNMDDGISDTPNTIGHSSCDLYTETCGSLDNVQNYMEYSYCGKMFTLGQKDVMRSVLYSTVADRNILSTQANLIATGTNDGYTAQICAPIADFTQSSYTGCPGMTVAFNDASYNTDTISSWQWNFPGGTPSTSTDPNPVITYNTPGQYNVSLQVVNPAGTDTKTYNDIIYIIDNTGGETAPFTESIENTYFPQNNSDPSKNWRVVSDGPSIWSRSTYTSHSGNACVRICSYMNPPDSEHELISPIINVDTTYHNYVLSFWLAFAKRNDDSNDRLRVYVSNNCGENWHLRYSKSANALQTTGGINYGGTFTPSASQWRQEFINLGSYTDSGQIMIKFHLTSNDGNWLYIDDINIAPATGIEKIPGINDISIYPNPFDEFVYVKFYSQKTSDMYVTVSDIMGNIIFNEKIKSHSGSNQIILDNFSGLSKGIYFVNLNIDKNTYTGKIIKTN